MLTQDPLPPSLDLRVPDPSPLSRLTAPRSVAVIGASDDTNRIGGRPIAYMRAAGFQGRIFPVNPKRSTVQGLTAFPSVDDLPEAPDVAIVAVPAAQSIEVIGDLARRGTGAAIVFTSGFAEVGPVGWGLEQRLVAAAQGSCMRILGPNCLGLLNVTTGFCGSFASVCANGFPEAGPIGIASQSGAYGAHILSLAMRHGLGLSQCIMTGNEADITVGEIIRMMVEDPQTEVITAYLEGLNDPEALLAGLASAHEARKPVVVMKVGSSPLGSEAAQSHTASLAGNDAVFDAVLAEYGVVRARSTEDMLDIARTATRRIFPVNNTLGVLTVSGGAGVLISDAAHAVGLPMPQMPVETQRRLKEILPIASPLNPVDCTAQFLNDDSLIGTFGEAIVEEGGYSAILGFFTYAGGAPGAAARICAQLNPIRLRNPDKLFVFCLLADPAVVRAVERAGYVVFEDPTRAVNAIAAMGRFGEAFARAPARPGPTLPVFALPASTPTEADGKRILSGVGISAAPETACTQIEDAVAAAEALGYPVVLKILSPDILHKSEIGGVLLDVAEAEGVRAGYALLLERAAGRAPDARIEGVLVAKQLKGGVECILGIQRDPVFGPIAMVGLGGIFVEVLRDVALRRCPFDDGVAEAMIRGLRGASLLEGARGRPPADVPALARMLSRLSAFAAAAGPALASVDLNPVLVMPMGEGAYAADAVLEIAGGGA